MASCSSSQLRVSSESLNLSASTFTSAIDSWIPANWGSKRSEKDRAAEFDNALRTASLQGESDRLGVGHAEIGKPRQKGPSLSVLEKRLGKVDKKAGNSAGAKEVAIKPKERDDQDEDEDQEDSRARSVGSSKKRNNTLPDFLTGKKKGKAKAVASNPLITQPLLNLGTTMDDNPNRTYDSPPRTPPTASTSPSGSGSFPFAGPVALDSPQAKRTLDTKISRKRLREDDDSVDSQRASAPDGGTQESRDASPALGSVKQSKSQKRRENRKKAKLAEQNAQ